MNPKKIKSSISKVVFNLLGWKTNRKIIVIESDDWGCVGMPSKEIYNKLLVEGFKPDKNPYMKYDSLESEQDLIALFEVLSSFKDKNGDPAVMTVNYVMANPDFKKIKESNFTHYFYEPFTETYKKYPDHKNSYRLLTEGIRQKFFFLSFMVGNI